MIWVNLSQSRNGKRRGRKWHSFIRLITDFLMRKNTTSIVLVSRLFAYSLQRLFTVDANFTE